MCHSRPQLDSDSSTGVFDGSRWVLSLDEAVTKTDDGHLFYVERPVGSFVLSLWVSATGRNILKQRQTRTCLTISWHYPSVPSRSLAAWRPALECARSALAILAEGEFQAAEAAQSLIEALLTAALGERASETRRLPGCVHVSLANPDLNHRATWWRKWHYPSMSVTGPSDASALHIHSAARR